MDDDDFKPLAQSPLGLLAAESLDALSRDELAARIARLEAEIGRARAAIDEKSRGREAAEKFFST